jgi:CDP-diacylglycerol--serine O-phosphatidyltransferase
VKKIAILPTLLTLGNAVCGFAAIACASKATPATEDSFYYWAGVLVLAAMVFDALDGYVARLSRTASNFGVQLDSLCDAISFGVAPAFLLLRMGPHEDMPRLHQAVAVIATLFMVCAILRLARFNVETTPEPLGHKRFRGLPSPGAAGCIASLTMLRSDPGLASLLGIDMSQAHRLVGMVAPLGALTVALLMVSRVPYPHLTKQVLRGRKHFSHLIQVILAGFILWIIPDLAPVLVFWLYALGIPVYVWLRGLRRRGLPAQAPGLDEGMPQQGRG